MKKVIIAVVLIFNYQSLIFSQTKNTNDTTVVKAGDIYSNFSKENYSRRENLSFVIPKNNIDSDTVLKLGYDEYIQFADKFYRKLDFKNAANLFRKTFVSNNDLGKINDRLKLACCYVNLKNFDSAFLQLERIVTKGHYTNLEELKLEKCFIPLHEDKQWLQILTKINKKPG